MMPFLYATPPAISSAYPMLVISNPDNALGDDSDVEDNDAYGNDEYFPLPTETLSGTISIPMTALSQFANVDRQIPTSTSTPNYEQEAFRLRLNVDGFLPNELNVSIRQGRIIVRGKHIAQAPVESLDSLAMNSTINENDDDNEPDFVAKEFKRSFTIPPNADIRKAHAQYHPQHQLLVIEVPFQNITPSSQTRFHHSRLRSTDVFFTIITILLIDRALRITYHHFMINEYHRTRPSSQSRN